VPWILKLTEVEYVDFKIANLQPDTALSSHSSAFSNQSDSIWYCFSFGLAAHEAADYWKRLQK